ncbi:2'-5' RNA ligase family protein [Gelidibacter salicanalis]|uniref:Mutarotase n=1 Tax=Gelidibacter salicanalis TaxID=291193 RepID=A0A934KRD4_9FLAO|nr:mutarotase [Gelidibacter salicanalis]MBJ7882409.1 mutarotase [Gelidibacter salicanalis]
MNLEAHYSKLYKTSIDKIASERYEIDHMIHSDQDNRFGLSLVIRPSYAVKNEIQKFLNKLKSVAPDQYYYPDSDLHITVISIISCYDGFDMAMINVPAYSNLIKQSLQKTPEISISCRGITASPSCIMVQGFLNDASLNNLRDNLRAAFKNSDLQQSMDERYVIHTAHATVFRFSQPLQETKKFLKMVEKYSDYNFGTFKVNALELVHNDWYHREKLSTKLHEFDLDSSATNSKQG